MKSDDLQIRSLNQSIRAGAIAQLKGLGCLKQALLLALACLILSAALAAFARVSVDYPAILFLNRFARRSVLVDHLSLAMTELDLLQGAALVAGIWLVWFDSNKDNSRVRVAAGVLAASYAGLFSRVTQLLLPTHPRPLHDAALPFIPPLGVNPDTLNSWPSFPSDHGALFFALAAVIAISRPRLGIAALCWVFIISLARVYEGYHFPTDITGAFGIGVFLVCLSQLSVITRLCLPFVRWAKTVPNYFYAGAFLGTFEVATLFDDIRSIGRGLGKPFLHAIGLE